MDTNHDFLEHVEGNIFKNPQRKKRPPSIIKNDTLKYGEPKKIEPFDFSKTNLDNSLVTAIEENGQVKGFIFECACGEVVEVLLDYEDISRAG